MSAKDKPPVLVPNLYAPALYVLSKAALIDLVWILARRIVGNIPDDSPVIVFDCIAHQWHILGARRGDPKYKFERERNLIHATLRGAYPGKGE